MTSRKRPIGIDLFAGAGGLSLGFEKAGFDVVAAVEVDPIHCAVHSYNFPDCQSICADVRTVGGDDLRREVRALRNRDIDVVFGGAPCQGFSLIGKRAMDDPRNELVKHFVRIVLELQPKYFVFENVQGITVGPARQILDEVIELFKDNGYQVLDKFRVLNAAEYGVPQDRRRLFLLGARSDQKLPTYPNPTCAPRGKSQAKNKTNLPLGPSVWDAIGDLPDADRYKQLNSRDWVKAKFEKPSKYVRSLNSSDGDFSYEREYDPSLLTSSMRTDHNELSRSRFAATEHGQTEPVSRFLKLDPDGICNTLRAGTGGDRGAFTSPRPIHPYYHRCITVREAARLHSYPDWFRLHSTKWHGMRQIGNSVPPLLAQAVASQLIKSLGAKPLKPAEKQILGDPELLEFNMSQAAFYFDVDPDIAGKRTRVKLADRVAINA